jgi:glycosyltransferase involved in cell wall biosynthesis
MTSNGRMVIRQDGEVTGTKSAHIPANGKNPDLERLRGKRVASVVFSHYPSDPRPRRAAEALAQLGMRVEVVSLRQTAEEPRRERFNGVDILRLPLRRWRGGKLAYMFQYASFLAGAFIVLAWRCLRGRYSLVHVHNMPDILVFSALVPRLFGAKVLLDLHDPMPELMMTIYGFGAESRAVRVLKRLERWSIRFADAVLTVNQACRRIFSTRSCAAEKVSVIMNSPDEKIFAPEPPDSQALSTFSGTGDPSRPFVIMYHGSLVERHGLDLAVKALETIRGTIPGAELRVYGQKTPFLEKVLSSIVDPGLRSAVRYLGPKKLEEIAAAIRQCDVGVIPNRRSIFTELNTPTRIFEYLSQGKPVIAPRVPGILDYFDPRELVFFELGDAADLARKLEQVFQDPEETRAIVTRGQAVHNNHKWSNERRRFIALVSELLAGGRTSRGVSTQNLSSETEADFSARPPVDESGVLAGARSPELPK